MTIEMDHAWTPPPVLAPNIYPVDWRVEDRRALNVYERAKDLTWNPTRLAWDTIDVDALERASKTIDALGDEGTAAVEPDDSDQRGT